MPFIIDGSIICGTWLYTHIFAIINFINKHDKDVEYKRVELYICEYSFLKWNIEKQNGRNYYSHVTLNNQVAILKVEYG